MKRLDARPDTTMRRLSGLAAIAAIAGTLTMIDTAALAQQKTAKQCTDEWRANKAENQAKGITERAYVAQCRAGGTVAAPAVAPAPQPAPTAAPAPRPTTAPRPRETTAVAPSGANQFGSEAQA